MAVHSSSNESESEHIQDSSLGEVGTRLKLLREACGFSQRELAKRAGLTNSSISIIEQGQVSPSVQSLGRILAAFPIKLTDFFAFSLPEIDSYHEIKSLTGCQLNVHVDELSIGEATSFRVMPVDVSGVVTQGELMLITLQAERRLVVGENFYVPAYQCYRVVNFSNHSARLLLCSLATHKF